MEAKRNGSSALGVGGWLPLQHRQERLLGLSRREASLRNTATTAAASATASSASATAAASALVQAGRRGASGLRLSKEQVDKRGYSWVLRSDRRVHEPWVPAQCALGGRATAYIGQAAVHHGQPEGCF